MLNVRFQLDDLASRRVFLADLNDGLARTKAPLVVVGTVIQIVRSNDVCQVFFVEDVTRAQVVEVFNNRLSIDFSVQKGDILEIKCVYAPNKFGEKILKAFKLRRIDLNAECVHYLEACYERRQPNEEEIVAHTSRLSDVEVASILPRREILERKVLSLAFGFFLKNQHRFVEANGFIAMDELRAMNELVALKRKMDDGEFEAVLGAVVHRLEDANLLKPFENGAVINLSFFQNFDEAFVNELKARNANSFTFKEIFDIFNELASAKRDIHFLNKEYFYEFINKLMFRKQLYFVDEKQETFGVF